MKKLLVILINVLGIMGLSYLVFLVLFKSSNISSILMWELFLLVSIYLNGMCVRMIHMSCVKLENSDNYDYKIWTTESDLRVAYFLPLIMEWGYCSKLTVLINMVKSEYAEEGIKTPILYKVGYILLKSRISIVLCLILIFLIGGFSLVTNDYTLYMGLMAEELQMSLIGIVVFIMLALLIIYNYIAYTIVEMYLGVERRFTPQGIIITVSLIITLYTAIMLILTFIFGLMGIQLELFSTIINLRIVNYAVIFAPILSIVQVFILQSRLKLFQHVIDRELV